ncbi:N-acetylmuramoyl-L-alanine amidase [Akkermansia massiliensis]|nr:N-acetylmuramoyl-L-alanine amidase [Akkermansia massiliensis]
MYRHVLTGPVSQTPYVLRKTVPPAVLVECGFLSNPGDASLLRDTPRHCPCHRAGRGCL